MNPRSTFLVTTALTLGGVFPLIHCSVEDEEAGNPSAPTTGGDASVVGDATLADAPTNVPGLCAKVGGSAIATTIADQIVANASADCRIGIYFTSLSAEKTTHVKECMRRQLADLFQCEASSYAGFKSSTGRECRSMAEAHAGLMGADGRAGLNGSDYLAYVQSAQKAMRASGLSDADVTRVTALFNAQQPAVAPRVSERNTNCTCAGGALEGTQCTPDGGYKPFDAGKDSAPPIDAGPKDTSTPDTAPADASDSG